MLWKEIQCLCRLGGNRCTTCVLASYLRIAGMSRVRSSPPDLPPALRPFLILYSLLLSRESVRMQAMICQRRCDFQSSLSVRLYKYLVAPG